MVIRPPAVDATEPTVAIALTVAPSAAPAATVARPSAFSLAMVASEASVVLQTGAGASATGWLRASTAEAWKSGVSPAGTRMDEGVTMTCATAWVTATARVASFPSAEAWTIALPFATAVTRPPCVTVATVASLLAYAMATPGMGAPWASSGTALMSRVSPRLVNGAAEVGVSETLATGGRDGPSVPQASRTERAMGQARRSGNPASSATILPGLTRRSRKGFDRRRNASLHCARSIPP